MHTWGDTQALGVAYGIGLGTSESCTPRAWSTTVLWNTTTTSCMWLPSPWNATGPNWDVLGVKISSWNLKVKVKSLSYVWLFVIPWTVVYQAPPSMGFSRQECWSGLPFSFSRGSSWPRDWTRVSLIVGRRFIIWATREALGTWRLGIKK